mmetsp:Transcript_16049/g.53808  ORF Transcript_16049/g.53808 Transcript_16049/m.53808 type:complete len:145 (-) Transcript_16049:596-1030(-)
MDASRAIVRQCIGSGISEFDSPSLPQKIYLMAYVRNYGISPESGSDEQQTRFHGWNCKHNFGLKARKCSPIILYVGSHQFCSSAPEDSTFVSETNLDAIAKDIEAESNSSSQEPSHTSIWLQCQAVLKGLVPENSSGSDSTSMI